MKVDHEAKKIGLSIRRARPEEWDIVVANYEVNQVVPGVVTKLVTFGAFARIEGPVEGLIHVSELVDRRISHPREVLAEGDVVPVKIVRIERDRHRLGLSLRQARAEAERVGWVFNGEGGIQMLPEEVADRFGVERGKPRLPLPPPTTPRATPRRPPPAPRPPPSAPWKRRCSGPASPRKTSAAVRPRHSRVGRGPVPAVAGTGRAIRHAGSVVP